MDKDKGNKSRNLNPIFIILGLLVLVFLCLNICIGSVGIGPGDILGSLFGSNEGVNATIVRDIRLPRAVAALFLGGGLAVSGYLLQTFFHNPIAGPFILGISSGAKLTVALFMVFTLSIGMRMSSFTMIAAAFAGSMMSMGFVLMISRRVNRMSILIICGVMIGYICSAVTDFVITFADDSNIVNLHGWSLGSFSGMNMEHVRGIMITVIAAVIAAFLLSKPISAYQLGDVYAMNAGVDLKKLRILLILISGVLSATVTAFAGPVSFVGVAVPHLCRSVFKTARPIVMIPASFMGGALFCLICDLIARTVFAPTELSISTVTAVFGAPIVVYMMIRSAVSNDRT